MDTSTSLYISNDSLSSSYFDYGWVTGQDTSLNITYGSDTTIKSYDNNYKVIKYNRKTKKKKGDISGANSTELRLSLLSPTIVYKYLKEKFRPLERKRLEGRIKDIAEILLNSRLNNQVALSEKIEKKFGPFLREQEMIACGFDKFIDEKVLKIFLNSVKNKIIKITPIKNYVRIIPKKVSNILEKAQRAKLFDAYVVLHTDPNDNSVEKTEAEKKDPILFGLINNSNRYYFIADWEDELCNLTMDQIIDTLGLDETDYIMPNDVNKAMVNMLLTNEGSPEEIVK